MISEVLENRVIWTVNDTENTHRQKDDVDESVHKKAAYNRKRTVVIMT